MYKTRSRTASRKVFNEMAIMAPTIFSIYHAFGGGRKEGATRGARGTKCKAETPGDDGTRTLGGNPQGNVID